MAESGRSDLAAKSAAREEKKQNTKRLAALLGAELDGILEAQKEREAAAKGEKAEAKYTLYMSLYEYKSDDPQDLQFGPGEILRVFDDSEDWYEGEDQQGNRGYFPNTYVRKINAPTSGGAKSVEGLENS